MSPELADVADPPDMVTSPILFGVGPVQLLAADLLADLDRLQHRAVAVTPAAHVVDLPAARRLEELVEGTDQIVAVDVVPNLLPSIAEDGVGCAFDIAFHEVSQEAV